MKTVNIQTVSGEFSSSIREITSYTERCNQVFADEKKYLSYCYENAIIMLYKAFEQFVLRSMIACLNHDHSYFQEKHGIKLGKHINDDICEFLITKGGFFDFRGKSGLYKVLNEMIGADHTIATTFKKAEYKDTIDQLCTIRNYAAHNSYQSKQAVLKTFNLQRISSAGSFLKQQHRFENIANRLLELAEDVKNTHLQ